MPTCFPATSALPLTLLSAVYLDGRKLNVKYLPLQWYVTLLTLPRTGSSRIPLEEVYLFSFFSPPSFLCPPFLFCLPSLPWDRHLNLVINEDTVVSVCPSNRSLSVPWMERRTRCPQQFGVEIYVNFVSTCSVSPELCQLPPSNPRQKTHSLWDYLYSEGTVLWEGDSQISAQ